MEIDLPLERNLVLMSFVGNGFSFCSRLFVWGLYAVNPSFKDGVSSAVWHLFSGFLLFYVNLSNGIKTVKSAERVGHVALNKTFRWNSIIF